MDKELIEIKIHKVSFLELSELAHLDNSSTRDELERLIYAEYLRRCYKELMSHG